MAQLLLLRTTCLPLKTAFSGPMGWSLVTGFTVCAYVTVLSDNDSVFMIGYSYIQYWNTYCAWVGVYVSGVVWCGEPVSGIISNSTQSLEGVPAIGWLISQSSHLSKSALNLSPLSCEDPHGQFLAMSKYCVCVCVCVCAHVCTCVCVCLSVYMCVHVYIKNSSDFSRLRLSLKPVNIVNVVCEYNCVCAHACVDVCVNRSSPFAADWCDDHDRCHGTHEHRHHIRSHAPPAGAMPVRQLQLFAHRRPHRQHSHDGQHHGHQHYRGSVCLCRSQVVFSTRLSRVHQWVSTQFRSL